MEKVHNDIDLSQFKDQLNASGIRSIEDGFFFADIKYPAGKIPFLYYPTKIDAYIGIFVVSGNLKLSVDLREFNIRRNSFSVITPGNIIKIENNEKNIGCHIIAICLSNKNMMKLRFDMTRLFSDGFSPVAHPTIVLNKTEIALAIKYYSLMKEVMASKRPYMKDSMMTLCSSLVYEVAGSWQNRLSEKELSSPDANNRPKELYDRFIKLVSKHHLQERGVQFYADSLCISPKYLAKVVKTVSGKTATYWIDSYVILEAQNLLRYSDDTIKQIVYKLNFSNQSVFYKFFKAHTGHTPSEYRKK
jgi:AraC-like DNA-binding protein